MTFVTAAFGLSLGTLLIGLMFRFLPDPPAHDPSVPLTSLQEFGVAHGDAAIRWAPGMVRIGGIATLVTGLIWVAASVLS